MTPSKRIESRRLLRSSITHSRVVMLPTSTYSCSSKEIGLVLPVLQDLEFIALVEIFHLLFILLPMLAEELLRPSPLLKSSKGIVAFLPLHFHLLAKDRHA